MFNTDPPAPAESEQVPAEEPSATAESDSSPAEAEASADQAEEPAVAASDDEHAAAIKIQAIQRGKQDRNEVARQHQKTLSLIHQCS